MNNWHTCSSQLKTYPDEACIQSSMSDMLPCDSVLGTYAGVKITNGPVVRGQHKMSRAIKI